MTNSTHVDTTNIETTVIAYCVLLALLMPLAIAGNSLVLAAIFKTPTLRSPSTVFLCTLAFSDLLVGILVQPLYIVSEFTTDAFVDPLVELASYIACGVSLWTMTAISVDRFMALHYHMRYVALVTTSRAIYTSLAIFFTISLLSLLIYFWSRNTFLFLMSISTSISLLISTVSYIKIYRIVRRHQTQIFAQQQATQSSNDGNNTNILNLKRSAVNTFVFYIVMVLCYIPVTISLCIYILSFENWTKAWNFADVAVIANSSVNPILYGWRLRDLRTEVLKVGRKMLCKETNENHHAHGLSPS